MGFKFRSLGLGFSDPRPHTLPVLKRWQEALRGRVAGHLLEVGRAIRPVSSPSIPWVSVKSEAVSYCFLGDGCRSFKRTLRDRPIACITAGSWR